MIKNKKFAVLGLILASSVVTGLAHAGAKWISEEVYVSGSIARGAMGYVRNTANNVEYMQCSVMGYSNGSTPYAYCSARNAAGTTYSCISTNTSVITSAAAVSSDSYVTLYKDANGNCTYVQTENGSGHQVKNHN